MYICFSFYTNAFASAFMLMEMVMYMYINENVYDKCVIINNKNKN